MQDVRRKPPIKYNKDGSISLDGSGVKILRLLEPQGEPDVIECDGMRYVPERTCEIVRCETGEPAEYDCDEVIWHCESCHEEVAIYAYNENGDTWADKPAFCPNCGAKVVE